MPAESQAQFRFMQAVAHGGIQKKGLSPAKAKEFVKGQSYAGLPKTAGKGQDVAKKDTFDPKKDAMEKRKGLPDTDTPRVRALEKKAGIEHGKGDKVGQGAGMSPGKVFGSTRRSPPPQPGKAMRKPPAVGYGQDRGFPVKKGGVAKTGVSNYLGKRGSE